jgi:hypothetical protein
MDEPGFVTKAALATSTTNILVEYTRPSTDFFAASSTAFARNFATRHDRDAREVGGCTLPINWSTP